MIKGSKEYIEFRRKANERNRRYYAKPEVKARKKIYKKKYDLENKEKNSKYGYELRARPEYQVRVKKWREENKEHLRLKGIEWRKKNKLKIKLRDRQYFLNNKKKVNESHSKWKSKNKDKVKGYYKKYNSSPKGKLNFTKQNHLRLSKKFGNEFKLTQGDIKNIFERDKVCVYCKRKDNLELDHIVPISKGGKSIFNNFVVACRYCNSSKSNKDVFDWCKNQGIEIPKIVLKLLES